MVPFLDLGAQYDAIKTDVLEAIKDVLETRQFILGSHVAAFEQSFAAYCGARHAVAVNSGTSALHLALLAAGVGPGDEVITVPFTFIATIAAIRYCNATPVLADIEPRSFNLDPAQVERAITERTKAILPVHLYGQCADMDAINAIARDRGIAVIEDAAQAHGAEYKGRRAGSLGQSGCFSFYPTKNLGAYGEGGIVTTNDDDLATRVRLLRDWGADRKYHHVLRGFNYRMEGLQGAILGVKMRYIEQWTAQRRAVAARYDQMLADAEVACPAVMHYTSRHVYHTYTVRSAARDELQRHLAAEGVQTAIHYGTPAHLQPAHSDLGYKPGDFPQAEAAAREVLSLPMYPELPADSQERVAAAVKSFAAVAL